MSESLFLGRFEPAKGALVFDSGSLQGEHDLGQVQALDFGELLRQTIRVFFQPTKAAGKAPALYGQRGRRAGQPRPG